MKWNENQSLNVLPSLKIDFKFDYARDGGGYGDRYEFLILRFQIISNISYKT